MFAVIIHEKGGQPRRQEFAKGEVTIGRVQGNDIILPKQNVSKRHSRVVVKDGKFIIVDLKSTNGTYVNGRKIASPMVIKQTDKIYIGDFILSVEGPEGAGGVDSAPVPAAAPPAPPAPPAPVPVAAAPVAEPARPKAPPPPPRPKAPPPAPAAPAARPAPVAAPVAPARPAPAARPAPQRVQPAARAAAAPAAPVAFGDSVGAALCEAHERLAIHLEESGTHAPLVYAPGHGVDELLWKRVEQAAGEVLSAMRAEDRLPPELDESIAMSVLVSEVAAAGALTNYLDDPSIERLLVNGPTHIYACRDGAVEPVEGRFSGGEQVVAVIERLLRSSGTHLPHGATFAEGYLADGTRVHLAYPVVGGPYVTIDRPRTNPVTLEGLVANGALSENMATFLQQAVAMGRNLIIASNDVDARFELIAALLTSGASGLRVVAVEGGGRLTDGPEHLVILSGAPGADNSSLVQQALKMRPDRLVVADCRGPETFHALSAMAGGVNGGLIGVDAESPDDAMIRLVRQASLSVNSTDDRLEALAREAADILVQLLRYADGRTSITQIIDIDGELNEVFSGLGTFQATGHVPRWVSNAQSLGHDIDLNIFR